MWWEMVGGVTKAGTQGHLRVGACGQPVPQACLGSSTRHGSASAGLQPKRWGLHSRPSASLPGRLLRLCGPSPSASSWGTASRVRVRAGSGHRAALKGAEETKATSWVSWGQLASLGPSKMGWALTLVSDQPCPSLPRYRWSCQGLGGQRLLPNSLPLEAPNRLPQLPC